MGTPLLYNWLMEVRRLCCCGAGWDSSSPGKYMEKAFQSVMMRDSPFSSDFHSAAGLCILQGRGAFCPEAKHTQKRLQFVRQWWGVEEKREQLLLLPSPFLCFVNPYSPCFSVWCHTKRDQWEHLDIPVFLPSLLPFPRSLIYLRPLHSAECTMCCHRAGRQCTETQPEREGEKGKVWVDFSADLEAHAPAIPAPVISPVSHTGLLPSLFFCLSLFLSASPG